MRRLASRLPSLSLAVLAAAPVQAEWSTATLSAPRLGLSAVTVDGLAIFAGGRVGMTTSAVVDVYDEASGSWSVESPLSVPRSDLAAAAVGHLALFAGGATGATTASAVVDVYDASVGPPSDPAAWSTATLSVARALSPTGAASTGTRAYFGGGIIDVDLIAPTLSDAVDVYDAASDSWSTDVLSEARYLVAMAALGNTVLFAGGLVPGPANTSAVDMLNAGTGVWGPLAHLSLARRSMAATSVGGSALFAGGVFLQASAVVDIYTPVGLNYCAAVANSTGCAATIYASGSASLAADDLELSAVCVPNQPFVFFHAAVQMQLPFGNGFRCAGVDLVRLPVGLASGNVATTAVDLPGAGITSPGVRNFQCWFRDPAAGNAGFNTSDAMEITFVP